MAAKIINSLNGYTLQDARVDTIDIPSTITAARVMERTAEDGLYGIGVRNNRLCLVNGGYYDDAAVFELVNQNIVLENSGDVEYEHDFTQVDDAAYIDWIINGEQCSIFVLGTNGRDEISYQFDGHFVEEAANPGTYGFEADNSGTTDYGINSFSVVIDETTPQYLFYVNKDERNENALTIQELALYLPGFVAVPFPGDMIEAGDGIVASGSGLRIDTNWLNQYLANNFGLTPSSQA